MTRLQELESELEITVKARDKALRELNRGYIPTYVYLRLYNRVTDVMKEINKLQS